MKEPSHKRVKRLTAELAEALHDLAKEFEGEDWTLAMGYESYIGKVSCAVSFPSFSGGVTSKLACQEVFWKIS